jgi:ferritin-like metal-binding protein YciE
MPSSADKVLQYLEEIHALETHLVSTLTAHIAMTPRSEYRDLLERHRYETRTQAQRIEQRLTELGQSSSLIHSVYDTATEALGQGISLVLAPINMIRGTGGEEKLLKNARDECASEAMEIAYYDALEAVAEMVGDTKTAVLAREHRTQEEVFLKELRGVIPGLATDVIDAEVEGHPHYDPKTTGAADTVRKATQKAKGTARKAKGQAETAAGQASAATRAVAEDVTDAAEATAKKAVDRVEEVVDEAEDVVEDAATTAKDTAVSAARSIPGEAEVEGEIRGATAEIDDELAIKDYDTLTVEQILSKLKTLSTDELAVVDGYERGGRSRKRVLDRIAALRSKKVDEQLAKL